MSRMINDRVKLAAALKRQLEAFAKTLAEERGKLFGPLLGEDETLPDVELELELAVRLLDHRLAVLLTAHGRHHDAKIALKVLRKKEDRAASAVHDEISDRRRLVDAFHRPGASARFLGLKGRTRRRPQGLLKQAEWMLSRIKGVAKAGSVPDSPAGSPEAWAEKLEPVCRELRDLVREVGNDREGVKKLRDIEELERGRFDRTARHVVRIAEGHFLLVGRKDLAQRIRRCIRRKKRPGPKKASKRLAKTQESAA